ncbi:MAG TPA: haloacid dehalogenase type II [Thermomicrobiales bacterium]|nr:haloacid dehalogenase type II [Thermomicrobiales bacterium]
MTAISYRAATFDCYGTLIDWEGGIGQFLYALALEFGDPGPDNGRSLRERWETIQFDVISGPYRDYKSVLAESLRRWMDERGYPWSPERGGSLARSMRSWQPFPDTRPALQQARDAGLRLVILSNADRDLIAHSLLHLEVPFEDVVTAEDCGSYKPNLANFETALARLGEDPARVLHVAFGYKYDIGPAKRLGMSTAWINRHAEPLPGADQPDFVWRDLWGLAKLAGGPGPGF